MFLDESIKKLFGAAYVMEEFRILTLISELKQMFHIWPRSSSVRSK